MCEKNYQNCDKFLKKQSLIVLRGKERSIVLVELVNNIPRNVWNGDWKEVLWNYFERVWIIAASQVERDTV